MPAQLRLCRFLHEGGFQVTEQKKRPLRIYFGGSVCPGDFDYVSACFAHTAREAKKLMWAQGDLAEECDWNYTDARVSWQRAYDGLAASLGVTEPRLIRDTKTQRDLGWSLDGDSRCESCDKATFDGDYPVCEECGQCAECGHTDDCPEKCDTCDSTGQIDNRLGGWPIDGISPCPDCNPGGVTRSA